MTSGKKRGGLNRRRKVNYSLQYSVIGFIAFSIFAILSVTVLFNVNSVVISGSSVYSADEIITVSGIKSGDNLIRKSMSRCSDMITQNLSYIEAAEVRRVFPSSVRITVSPGIEAAYMEQDDVWYLVSATGRILRIDESRYNPALPVFYGTDPAEELSEGQMFESKEPGKTDRIYELMKKTPESALAGKIVSIDVTDRFNISMNYEDRITIVFRPVTDLEYNYRFADIILRQNIGSKEEGTLTLTPQGASFIDKEGLLQNERTYLSNLEESLRDESIGETDDFLREDVITVVNIE